VEADRTRPWRDPGQVPQARLWRPPAQACIPV